MQFNNSKKSDENLKIFQKKTRIIDVIIFINNLLYYYFLFFSYNLLIFN